jgi:hypothetical protein
MRQVLSNFLPAFRRISPTPSKCSRRFCQSLQSLGASDQKPDHSGGQKVVLGRLHEQVKMIQHEAKGENLPTGPGADSGEVFDWPSPVLVIAEDSLQMIAAIYDMVNRAGEIDSHLA